MDETTPYTTQHDGGAPQAPPTVQGELGEGPRSVWPKVFGIISIVFGSLGLTCTCGSMVSLVAVQQVVASGQGPAGMPAGAMGPMWWNVISSTGTVILAGVLLASGIMLVRRQRIGVMGHVWWAIGKIVWVVGTGVIGFLLVTLPMMRGQGAGGAAGTAVPGMGLGVVFGVFGLALYLAYPITVLVWMNRRVIKHEVADWR